MRVRGLLFAAVMSLSGCSAITEPDDLAVVFSADRTEYVRGDTARVTLLNEMDGELGYNLCYSARERRTGSDWTRLSPLRMCTADLARLAPGAQVVMKELTSEWSPGRYRVVTTIEILGTGVRSEIFTEPFVVR